MKVLMCSYFKFPNACAGALRHEKLAQMLKALNHEVLVAAIGKANGFKTEEYKSIPFVSLRYGSAFLKKVKTRLLYWRNLKKLLAEFRPDAVLMDDMRPAVTKKLKRYAKKHNLLLVHDSVEWYSKEQFKLGALAPQYIKKNIINRRLVDNSCRVIAISSFLENHFSAKGIKCVNIPIVVAEEDLVSEKTLGEGLNLVYAGQAGKKDYLNLVLEAIALLDNEERSRLCFNVLGCNQEQLIASGIKAEFINKLKPSLNLRGRVSREEVLEALKTANFTVLMRPDELRYAKAGFPTKAVESLAHSTPIIGNLTSDLGRYLADGVNALIAEECSAESLAAALRRALELTKDQRLQMCKNAYKTAEEQLCYKKFLPLMEEIFET